jgi:hypothetical protein
MSSKMGPEGRLDLSLGVLEDTREQVAAAMDETVLPQRVREHQLDGADQPWALR